MQRRHQREGGVGGKGRGGGGGNRVEESRLAMFAKRCSHRVPSFFSTSRKQDMLYMTPGKFSKVLSTVPKPYTLNPKP